MNADHTDDVLDDRIRALLADAVATAPDAPQVDVRGARDVRLVTVSTPARGSYGALIGVAAVVAMIVGLWVVMSDGGSPAATPGTDAIVNPPDSTAVDPTYLSEPSLQTWPTDVAVVVASDRGVERVAAPNGTPEITRIYSERPVSRAFELSDGSLVLHTLDGLILREYPEASDSAGGSPAMIAKDVVALDDAQLDADGNLDLVYRTGATGSGSTTPLTVWRPPAEPLVIELPGGWAVDYGRFDLLDDDIVASGWVDDTLQRGIAAFDATGMPVDEYDVFFGRAELGTRDVVGDVLGQLGVLSGSTFDVNSADLRPVDLPELAVRGGDLDLQGATLAIDRPTGADQVVDLQTRELFDVPIADGVTTVSQRDFGDPTDSGYVVENLDLGAIADCMGFDVEAVDVSMSSEAAPPDPVASSPIEVDGRPAVLLEYSSGLLAAELAPPHWCGLAWLGTTTLGRDQFVDLLSGVKVTERIPAGLPPMVLAGGRGVAYIVDRRVQAVTTEPSTRAVVLGDGDVVYQRADGLTFRWDLLTGAVEEMWAAVSWVAAPVIHDTYRGQLVFSVADRLYVDGTPLSVDLGVEPTGRLSVSRDGLVVGPNVRTILTTDGTAMPDWIDEVDDGSVLWSVDGSSGDYGCCVAVHTGGAVTVTDPTGGSVQWARRVPEYATVSGLDVHSRWVALQVYVPEADTPAAWGERRVWLVHTDFNSGVSFHGMTWVSFAD